MGPMGPVRPMGRPYVHGGRVVCFVPSTVHAQTCGRHQGASKKDDGNVNHGKEAQCSGSILTHTHTYVAYVVGCRLGILKTSVSGKSQSEDACF